LGKLLKYIENEVKVGNIQDKFPWIPLHEIFAIGVTKSHFVLYVLVENFYKSNLGVFNYKNT
jgi:hypothetical protein